MKTILAVLIALLTTTCASAHPGHGAHDNEESDATGHQTLDGSPGWEFLYRADLSELPVKPEVLLKSHGGFAVDRSVAFNERRTWLGLPVAGAIEISPDLKTKKVVGGPFKGANPHNATFFQAYGTNYLAFPGNGAGKVWVTDTNLKLWRVFDKPEHAGRWAPTDTEFAGGLLRVPSGYGDKKIYSADVLSGEVTQGVWNDGSWGDRGPANQPGLYSTSHGITRIPGTEDHVTISDREHGQLQIHSADGEHKQLIVLPGRPHPCDIDYSDDGKVAVVGCLKDEGGETPAPFYILQDHKVVSKVTPALLGVPNSKHIHNASLRYVQGDNGRTEVYVLVSFWNPGGYAVFQKLQPWHLPGYTEPKTE